MKRQYYSNFYLYWQDEEGDDWREKEAEIARVLEAIGVKWKCGSVERCLIGEDGREGEAERVW